MAVTGRLLKLWAPGGLLLACLALFLAACAADPPPGPADAPPGLKDGYYTAEAREFDDQGWKEYLTIYVFNGRIVNAEYNSRNSRGFLRSWDMADKRRTTRATGTNQSRYSREYTVALLNLQDPDKVAPIPGSGWIHPNFQRLAQAAVRQAQAGDHRVALVRLKDWH
jgi:major membrane immunogen (membrane-anchored lipoprotein)